MTETGRSRSPRGNTGLDPTKAGEMDTSRLKKLGIVLVVIGLIHRNGQIGLGKPASNLLIDVLSA